MQVIKLLADKIEDELNDAEHYAKLALEYKETDPETAALFFKLSNDETVHQELLHKSVVGHIMDYRREHGEPPAAMQAVYDHLHKRFIEKEEKVLALQAKYKR